MKPEIRDTRINAVRPSFTGLTTGKSSFPVIYLFTILLVCRTEKGKAKQDDDEYVVYVGYPYDMQKGHSTKDSCNGITAMIEKKTKA